MMWARYLFSGLIALGLSACTQVGTQVANLPTKFSDLKIYKDIAYGDHVLQKLDLYVPNIDKNENKNLPVIIFFHGGAWQDGSKDMYAFVGRAYAKAGYIVAIPDYQKYPDVKFPTFIDDGAKSIAWLHDHIHTYAGDTENIFVMGHSSGAHTGALVLADDRYLKSYNKSPNIVQAFAGLSGPYDFIPQAEIYKKIFGPPENYPNMQVPNFIHGDEPPMLLLWGDEDETVIRRNLDRLQAKIKEEGTVDIKIYDGVGHVGTISSLVWFLPSKATTLEDTLKFFEKYKK